MRLTPFWIIIYYKVENIITPNQRHQLLDVYHSLETNPAHQDYNLFDVDKRHPTKEQVQMDCFLSLDNIETRFTKTWFEKHNSVEFQIWKKNKCRNISKP